MVDPLSRPGDEPRRTTVRRLPEKASHDVTARDALLDSERVAHLAVVDDGMPYAVPVAYARDGGTLLIHGSTASRLLRLLGAGAPTCLTVTSLEGLVLARSAFESSMSYRSVMVLGRCAPVDGDTKPAALRVLSERLMPGRWDDVRGPSEKDLAATSVLRLPMTEWSLKVSDGPPDDPPADLDVDTWAGVVPVGRVLGEPVPAPDLRGDHEAPAYVRSWLP